MLGFLRAQVVEGIHQGTQMQEVGPRLRHRGLTTTSLEQQPLVHLFSRRALFHYCLC